MSPEPFILIVADRSGVIRSGAVTISLMPMLGAFGWVVLPTMPQPRAVVFGAVFIVACVTFALCVSALTQRGHERRIIGLLNEHGDKMLEGIVEHVRLGRSVGWFGWSRVRSYEQQPIFEAVVLSPYRDERLSAVRRLALIAVCWIGGFAVTAPIATSLEDTVVLSYATVCVALLMLALLPSMATRGALRLPEIADGNGVEIPRLFRESRRFAWDRTFLVIVGRCNGGVRCMLHDRADGRSAWMTVPEGLMPEFLGTRLTQQAGATDSRT